jgi:hypothetical protein
MYSRGTGVAGVDGAAGERERGIGDGISDSAIEEGDRDRRKPEAATLFVRREGKGAGKRHGGVKQRRDRSGEHRKLMAHDSGRDPRGEPRMTAS